MLVSQENNRGGAEIPCHLSVLTTFVGLTGQETWGVTLSYFATLLLLSLRWIPQASIFFLLCAYLTAVLDLAS